MESLGTVHLFDEGPTLLPLVPEHHRTAARRALTAVAYRTPRRRWHPDEIIDPEQPPFGLLVLDGIMIRDVVVAQTTCGELVGGGELLRPWDDFGEQAPMAYEVEWKILEPARIAILDHQFAKVLAVWPGLIEPTILNAAGVKTSGAIGQTIFIGITNVVFTALAVSLLDRLGRRVFLLAGTVGCIVSPVVIGLYFQLGTLQHHASWLALACLIVYIASFAVGLGPVFWLMISEVFPLRIRGAAMSVCTVANWGFNFLVSFTFLSLVSAITRPGTFWLYGAIGIVALLFFFWRVPETKGRALEDIEAELGVGPHQRRRMDAQAA